MGELIKMTKEILLKKIIKKYKGLEDLCESLDSCSDLLDLGYIEIQKEQDIYNTLSEETAVTLWSLYRYVNYNDINHKYTFDYYVKNILK